MTSLPSLFERQARRRGEAIAVRYGSASLSYAELECRSRNIAYRLQGAGVGRGQIVAISGERSVELIVGLLAIMRAGAACLPLDAAYPTERLEFMVSDARARVAVVVGDLRPPWLRDVEVIMEGSSDGDVRSWEPVGVAGGDLAYILYTSGSTGRPKGVAMEHSPLTRLIEWQMTTDGALAAATTAHFAPISFDVSFQEIFSTLCAGGQLVLVPDETRRDPGALHRFICDQRIVRLFLPTAALHPLAGVAGAAPCLHLRAVYVAGEQLRITSAIRRWFSTMPKCRLHNHYGPTETHVVTNWTLEADPEAWPTLPPIGRPLPHVAVSIRDAHGAPVPEGSIGELFVGGPCLARGYVGRPGLTTERFVRDPETGERHYRTGDLGRTVEGSIEHCGRTDRQIKVGGHRIEPGEVEAALGEHPDVAAVAVAADPAGLGPRLVAYVAMRGAPNPAAPVGDERGGVGSERIFDARLVAYARSRLPDFMVPTVWVKVDRFPMTPSGKIDRSALPGVPSGRPPSAAPFVAPRDGTEQRLADLWSAILGVSPIGIDDNFFDLGGTSLLVATAATALHTQFGRRVPVVTLFERPTLRSLAGELDGREPRRRGAAWSDARSYKPHSREREDIAVIGLACRFPGANDPATYWRNLAEGLESISWTNESHGARDAISHGLFIGAAGVLPDVDHFDASVFGYSPREAALLDPQHRLFLECGLEALEDGGCDPRAVDGSVGVFGGAGPSTYFLNNLHPSVGWRHDRNLVDSTKEVQLLMATDKDFLTSRVSYKLDLRGPSVNVNGACATALVALHYACRALLAGDCEFALAGAANIPVPQLAGYVPEPGMVYAQDGHCRAFDESASGTVFGSGVGVVLLQPLADAVSAGRDIYAVVRGTAVFNDGGCKVGMTAPTVEGQARTIAAALCDADVPPDTVSFVEAHGTGTPLGDPIEVEALRRAFAGAGKSTCALGAVKTNVGHLGWASGMAGLIKAVLALRNQLIPPTLHFVRPNLALQLEDSPFFVNREAIDWTAERLPRRAGVSAFGLGGVNAHVVLEEAPKASPSEHEGRPWTVVPISARSPSALQQLERRLADHLIKTPEARLADIARTLSSGRRHREARRALLVADREQLNTMLGDSRHRSLATARRDGSTRIVGLFTGQGAEHPGMMSGLYATEPQFREKLDEFDPVFLQVLGVTPAQLLYEAQPRTWTLAEIQPLVFATQIALVALWKSWGIQFDAVLGHSLGEYAAACTAGIFNPTDGIRLVAQRGRLLESLSGDGAMATVFADEHTTRSILDESRSPVTIAAVNSPSNTTISGHTTDVRRAVQAFKVADVDVKELPISGAGHSALLDPVLDRFEAAASSVDFHPPVIDVVSNVTGERVDAATICGPAYWRRQLRQPVRFSNGLMTIDSLGARAFLEIGAGPVLIGFAADHPVGSGARLLPSVRRRDDVGTVLGSLAALYEDGFDIEWEQVHRRSGRLIHLPTYPFERERHWVDPPEPNPAAWAAQHARPAVRVDELLYHVTWDEVPTPKGHRETAATPATEGAPWLVLADAAGTGDALTQELAARGVPCTVRLRQQVTDVDLATFVQQTDGPLAGIVSLWPLDLTCPEPGGDADVVAEALEPLLRPVLTVIQALAALPGDPPPFWIATREGRDVQDGDRPDPLTAPLWGIGRTLALEDPRLRYRLVDLPADSQVDVSSMADLLVAGHRERELALRDGKWFAPRLRRRPAAVSASPPTGRGTHLIVGGLTGLGLWTAQRLAKMGARRLVLGGRRGPDATAKDVIATLRADGVDVVVVRIDVTDRGQIDDLLGRIHTDDHPIRGIVHAAGALEDALIGSVNWESTENVLAPKVNGVWNLDAGLVARGIEVDFFIAYSSATSVVGNLGQTSYAAANAFLDGFAAWRRSRGLPGLSINWGACADFGYLASQPDILDQLEHRGLGSITSAAAAAILERHLVAGEAQLAVLPNDWSLFLDTHHLNDVPFFAEIAPFGSPPVPAVDRNRLLAADTSTRHALLTVRVSELFAELIGATQDPGADNVPLVELGLDSLSAIQLRNRIQDDLDVSLSPRVCFEHPTQADLVRHLVECALDDAWAARQSAAGDPAPTVAESTAPTGATGTEERSSPTVQQRRWLSLNVEVKYGHRVVPVIFHATLENDAFGVALRRVVQRHDLLRYRYGPSSIDVLSLEDVIPADSDLFVNLAHLPDDQRAHAVADIVESIRARIPDPRQEVSWTVRCISLSDTMFAVLLGLQHLEFDGSSLSIFVEELRASYNAALAGTPGELEPCVQYEEYARHQHAYLESGMAADRAFFQGLYAAIPSTTRLPRHPGFDRTRAMPSRRYTPEEPLAGWDAIVEASRALGTSPFSFLFATYASLISKITGRPDAVIGMIKSGRSHARFRKTIGPFTTPFPVPIWADGRTPAELVLQVDRVVGEVMARPDYPAPDLRAASPVFADFPFDTYFTDTCINFLDYQRERAQDEPRVEVLEILGPAAHVAFRECDFSELRRIPGFHLVVEVVDGLLRPNYWFHTHRFALREVTEWAAEHRLIAQAMLRSLRPSDVGTTGGR
jgi:amino acid adenylation domain-containing protein